MNKTTVQFTTSILLINNNYAIEINTFIDHGRSLS